MIQTNQFRKGLKIEIDGEPFTIADFQHVKPGKGNAFVRTRLKSLTTGNVLERTFKSGEKVDKPDLEERHMQYLYREGADFHFMDNNTYEDVSLDVEKLGDAANYLKENIEVGVLFHNGSAIDVEVPTFVELKVVKTDPGIKGDTVSGATKPATLESGATIQVPLFVEENDVLRIDTRTCDYVERVGK